MIKTFKIGNKEDLARAVHMINERREGRALVFLNEDEAEYSLEMAVEEQYDIFCEEHIEEVLNEGIYEGEEVREVLAEWFSFAYDEEGNGWEDEAPMLDCGHPLNYFIEDEDCEALLLEVCGGKRAVVGCGSGLRDVLFLSLEWETGWGNDDRLLERK